MRIQSLCIPAILAVLSIGSAASAAVVSFALEGTAGSGLLPGNEVPLPTGGGTGDIGPGGITYDTATNLLSIDLRWGSGNGYTDMTGTILSVHLHDSATAPPAGYVITGGVVENLVGFDDSATSGSYVDSVTLDESDEAGLLAGHFYLNVHTASNPAGESRGQLIANIPAPAALPAGLAIFALVVSRRRKP